MIKKNDKKIINAWCMYDWANSVYALVITSALFPIYFIGITTDKTKPVGQQSLVNFMGMEFENSALLSYALSFSFLVIAIIGPILSGIADYGGKKKMFLKIFCYIGATSCSLMYFFTKNSGVDIAVWLSITASIGFAGSLVFYNAYLPEIATEDRFDKVSAKGFTMGYIGSVILLVVNLVMVLFYDKLGVYNTYDAAGNPEPTFAIRLSFLMVGIWWAGFAQITFSRLPSNVYDKKPKENLLTKGFVELKNVLGQVKKLPLLKRFLLSFFFYNIGVQTVMLLATAFGSKELKMNDSLLIAVILIVQLVAIPGAYLFSFISSKQGNIRSIIYMVVIWVFVCIASFFIQTDIQFIVLAGFVGMIMGGIQSMSRSTYAKFIPVETKDHASYFSLFDMTEKISVVVGTFFYGLINDLTGSMRSSSLMLTIFFVIGLILLFRIPSKQIYGTTLAESERT